MPLSHDTILLETVRTRRARLRSALLYGSLAGRRPVADNVRRLVGSLVLAAVACAGCVGFSVVMSVLAHRPAATAPGPAVRPSAGPSPTVAFGRSTGDGR